MSIVSDPTYYTMCNNLVLPDIVFNKLHAFLSAQRTMEQSSLSLGTATTFTSSTTVPTASHTVGAQESANCVTSLKGLTERCFGQVTTPAVTGEIFSRICLQDAEKFCTWQLPAESGFLLIKLDLIPIREIENLGKQFWWKKATHRANFVCPNANSAIQKKAEELMALIKFYYYLTLLHL